MIVLTCDIGRGIRTEPVDTSEIMTRVSHEAEQIHDVLGMNTIDEMLAVCICMVYV